MMRDPEDFIGYLEEILYLEQFIHHQDMSEKEVKKIRKSIKKEIKSIKNHEYDKCTILSSDFLEECENE